MDDVSVGGRPTCLPDLPLSVLSLILCNHLDVSDLIATVLVCRDWAQAALNEYVWRDVALARYPASSVQADKHYGGSYRMLVLDDNRRGATPTLPLLAECNWRANYLWSFYRCKVSSVEWQWTEGGRQLCLFFDARGEVDLRHPAESSLAVVKLAPPAGSSSAAAAAPLQGSEIPSPGGSPSFEAVHEARRPARYKLFARRPGHYKGCLTFSVASSAYLAAALGVASDPPRALVFCYACNLQSSGALSYGGTLPDYTSTVLLAGPGVWRGASPGGSGSGSGSGSGQSVGAPETTADDGAIFIAEAPPRPLHHSRSWRAAGGCYVEIGGGERAMAGAGAAEERAAFLAPRVEKVPAAQAVAAAGAAAAQQAAQLAGEAAHAAQQAGDAHVWHAAQAAAQAAQQLGNALANTTLSEAVPNGGVVDGLLASVLERGWTHQQAGQLAEWWVGWVPPNAASPPQFQDVAANIVYDAPGGEGYGEWLMGFEDGDDVEGYAEGVDDVGPEEDGGGGDGEGEQAVEVDATLPLPSFMMGGGQQ
ncbi:hypothetical protein FOA52_010029 [Chlamydomonas sp. UWO 241]|nr:hypothetical protein FOA52_010029 [Chlamydomonas sp. UWO 241]